LINFTEAQLESAIIELLGAKGYPHVIGSEIEREPETVLIKDDLRAFLTSRYASEGITEGEINTVIRKLENLSSADLYDSNKKFSKWLSDGFPLKREPSANKEPSADGKHRSKKDLFIRLIDYDDLTPESLFADTSEQTLAVGEAPAIYNVSNNQSCSNIYKIVNQLEIEGGENMRIPDGILYINGLPLVVFEFKSSIREDAATIHDAYVQLTTRYRRDVPQLFVFNTLCVISDGVNNKMGSFFAPYEFFYAWRKITGNESVEKDGIDSLFTMIHGLFDQSRLRDVIRNFIYFPDVSRKEEKIVCRYPQYYAANKLFQNIQKHKKPEGDGKGGTYFGATGCGKSFTMLFLSRLLMKSVEMESPTLVIITDRTDLDDQLSEQFVNAKKYIGDEAIVSVESRQHLREMLGGYGTDLTELAPVDSKNVGRNSGGVFLTTIHKFTEDTELLTERNNVICISDEAHRSQVNLDQKVRITEKGVKRTFGFAKYLHDSLPNATYVGFTGTPIDATLDVFGQVVDSYTMTESVNDEITVRIVYEGRAAKVLLDNSKLEEIEKYYQQCAEDGSSEYQIEESKKATASMNVILGDPERVEALAKDFVEHYETRIAEGSTIRGKAIFVSSSREIVWQFYQELKALRPVWFEVLACEEGSTLSEKEQKEIKPMERVKMVMTRGKDDCKELYDLLGNKDYRKELDRQFKSEKSNFKIAIVVDMWLTGFDVPFLDTIYIDKPVQRHNLVQTISRVNRKYEGKSKGLVVDYIGIKSQMNLALAKYSKTDEANIEDVQQSIVIVRDHLDLLGKIFHKFDSSPYFMGEPLAQLRCLNMAAEYVMVTDKVEKRFMALVKRMKAAYDICCGSEELKQEERDFIHFYMAVRSIVFKLTKGDAPDTAQMNAQVREMIAEALRSDGVEEIFKLGSDDDSEVDIFSDDYLEKISKIKLPNTKIKLLQQLLAKAIEDFKKTNRVKGMDFSKRFKALVDQYNERKEDDVLVSEVLDEFADTLADMIGDIKTEMDSFKGMGIDFEEKAFYDILKSLAIKYDFTYPEDKLIALSKAVKEVVDDKAKYTDWSSRDDIKAELKVSLIILLAEHGYPPVDRDEVYKEIFEQAENFKKYQFV